MDPARERSEPIEAYLEHWAKLLGVTDLLIQARG